MNRTIKFRGISINVESYGEWVYGTVHYIEQFKEDKRWFIFDKRTHKVNSETVGQFTGLKDRNGKEIYDGDIVIVSNKLVENKPLYRALIVWDEYHYALVNIEPDSPIRGLSKQLLNAFDTYEVIGNKFEHPHLLKGDETNVDSWN